MRVCNYLLADGIAPNPETERAATERGAENRLFCTATLRDQFVGVGRSVGSFLIRGTVSYLILIELLCTCPVRVSVRFN